MSENIIFEAVDLTTCPRKHKDFRLEHISFALPEGYIMGLIGKNGARYILKVISTISAPTSTGIRA